MYTIQSHSDVVDKEKRRRIVDVTFTDGRATFVQAFSFGVETEVETIKKTVKQFLDELNYVPPALTNLEPVTPAEPTPPTKAELGKQEWDANWNKLQMVDKLIASGVLTGAETQIVALRKKVKDDFKPAYLA
jgi:hypothetical protein